MATQYARLCSLLWQIHYRIFVCTSNWGILFSINKYSKKCYFFGVESSFFVKKFQICSLEIFLEFLSLFDLVCMCVRSVMARRIFLGQDCEKFTTSSWKILQEETLLYNVETVGKITESPSTTYYFKETLKGIPTRQAWYSIQNYTQIPTKTKKTLL